MKKIFAPLITVLILACQPTKKQENQIQEPLSRYDSIKSEYSNYGRWDIYNSTVKEGYSYEIWQKDSRIIGFILGDSIKIDTLLKDGNKYSIQNNKYGEFFVIDSNKNMKLFDNDGDLSDMGYTATLK